MPFVVFFGMCDIGASSYEQALLVLERVLLAVHLCLEGKTVDELSSEVYMLCHW